MSWRVLLYGLLLSTSLALASALSGENDDTLTQGQSPKSAQVHDIPEAVFACLAGPC